ncbi:MAG: hypothetical protein AB8B77_02840 [Alphaproteobacteria bacterium]
MIGLKGADNEPVFSRIKSIKENGEPIHHRIDDDLDEGKPTLPLKSRRQRSAVPSKAVANAIESFDAIAYTTQVALQKAISALEALAPLVYCDALTELAEFSARRAS